MRRSVLFSIFVIALLSFGYRSGTTSNQPSKIYLNGSILIRTTPGSDIRFYDLSNTKSPQERGRIDIAGNSDVAVSGNFMYADDDRNLIVLDITDVGNAFAVDTIKNVFQTPASQFRFVTEPMMDNVSVTGGGCGSCRDQSAVDAPMASGGVNASGRSSESVGQGGSMSRFAIVGDYLYCVDDNTLRVFDISQPSRPRFKNAVMVGWQIETVFPSEDKLYIGGSSGMYIYDISDEDDPNGLGEFNHPRRCDPVVVEGNTAYVTLRSSGSCGGNENELDIVDVSNPRSPRQVGKALLQEPYGLAVRDGLVLVCDGRNGVVTIDANNRSAPTTVGGISGITAYDIILDKNVMVVTTEAGFQVYDPSDLRHPQPGGRIDF